MNTTKPFKPVRTPGKSQYVTFRPPFTPKEKLVRVPINTSQPSKKFYFQPDKELENSYILGVKFQPGDDNEVFVPPVLSFQSITPGIGTVNISEIEAKFITATLIDKQNKKIMENYPLQGWAVIKQTRHNPATTSNAVAWLRLNPTTRLNWSKCYFVTSPGAPTYNGGEVFFSVIYAPVDMIPK